MVREDRSRTEETSMTKHNYPAFAATLLFLAVFVGGLLPAKRALAQPADKKPNVLFVLADNLGYGELGIYGGGVTRGARTPRIDKLASEGLRLTNMNMET
jgi:Sulfatase